jgi:histidinol-phosphate aminotransferase
MIKIPAHIENLAPYKPGKPGANMFGEAQPERQVVLSSNENNFGPSPAATKALNENLNQLHLYPDPTATALKNKLSELIHFPVENIMLGNGSDAILYSMFNAFLEGSDSMLTSHGAFVSAKVMSRMNNVRCVEVPMILDHCFDLDGILSAIDDTTKLIYIVNPNNPTGQMISEGAMRAFLDGVPDHILVVVDEAYAEFAGALASDYPNCAGMGYDNVLVLRTFSKAYGLAGLRLGYAIGPEYIIKALTKVKLTFDPNLAAQVAGLAALSDHDFLQKTIENNVREMAKLKEAYTRLNLEYIPSVANFITLKMADEEEVEYFYHQLLIRGVLTRRLASFGLPSCLRISIGLPDENDYMLKKLEEIVLIKKG